MKFKILGIEIERRTDILAFAAFIISIGSLLAQFVNLIRGPDVILVGPKIVTLYSSQGGDGKEYLRLMAGLTYLNNGSPGYNDILKSERAFLSMDKKEIKLTAKNYIDTKSDGKNLVKKIEGDAIPISLKAGNVHNHETEFVPFPNKGGESNKNFVIVEEFIKSLDQSSNLTIKFVIETYEGKKITKICHLQPQKVVKYLNDGSRTINDIKRSWSANLCN